MPSRDRGPRDGSTLAASLAARARERLRRAKHLDAGADLDGWGPAELASLSWTLASRAARGAVIARRLGRSEGLVLAERGVRIHHPWAVRAGRGLSLEEGCEIVGLSRRGITFGQRCSIGRFAVIRPTNVLFDQLGEGMSLGDGSNVGPYGFIGCSGFMDIGANVMMGPRVTLLAETHNASDASRPMRDQGVTRTFLTIGDDCWIGAGATVLPGVTVGAGSIVGAGSVVTRDVPPFSVVAGSPARVLRSRSGGDGGEPG